MVSTLKNGGHLRRSKEWDQDGGGATLTFDMFVDVSIERNTQDRSDHTVLGKTVRSKEGSKCRLEVGETARAYRSIGDTLTHFFRELTEGERNDCRHLLLSKVCPTFLKIRAQRVIK
jgi:hypothetical protein